MSVDTRAHVIGEAADEAAVVRRRTLYRYSGDSGRRQRAAVSFATQGVDLDMTLEDLGAALRVLGVSCRDLGYKPTGSRR